MLLDGNSRELHWQSSSSSSRAKSCLIMASTATPVCFIGVVLLTVLVVIVAVSPFFPCTPAFPVVLKREVLLPSLVSATSAGYS